MAHSYINRKRYLLIKTSKQRACTRGWNATFEEREKQTRNASTYRGPVRGRRLLRDRHQILDVEHRLAAIVRVGRAPVRVVRADNLGDRLRARRCVCAEKWRR